VHALQLEDPLEYLPCSNIQVFLKGQSVYDSTPRRQGLYLVIAGAVAISRRTRRHKVMLDLRLPDEFFGESALVGVSDVEENAIAFENSKVMVWTAAEVETLIAKRPHLAVALLQMVIRRQIELTRRIEGLLSVPIQQRLVGALIHLSQKTGEIQDDGSIAMPPLTHVFLSEYVGTSREIVTQYMNRFRRLGYIRYSRQGILLYVDSLRTAGFQSQDSTTFPEQPDIMASKPFSYSV
jgi:CRP/FNR family transcriptional regulator